MATTLLLTPDARKLISTAMTHTKGHEHKTRWREAVTLANDNQVIIKQRMHELRKKNAEIKAKVKADILNRPALIRYLRVPVKVRTSGF